MADPTVKDVFTLLDKLRHHHGYRLEPAAAPFFTLFLPCVMEEFYDIEIKLPIIPEFPIRKEDNREDNRESYKADYFALSSDRKSAFLIELKTDMNSLNKGQNEYLKRASEKKMYNILCDIKYLADTENKLSRHKYFHILKNLECLNLIQMCRTLEDVMYRDRSIGVHKLINDIRIIDGDFLPKIIYILPKNCSGKVDGEKVIDFCNFASIIEKRGEIGRRFAESLREWVKSPAGSRT